MFRAYGSFPNNVTETSSLRNPLENIQTWNSSPIAPPPTPIPSPLTTSSSSPDFPISQPNINSQRRNNIRHLQQSQFQSNLHAHQQQQQKSPPFYIEAMNNNNNSNNGFKNNDIKGKKKRNRLRLEIFPDESVIN